MAGGVLAPWAACRPEEAPAAPRTNWAGNLTYSTDRLHQPGTAAEAQEIVRNAPKVRPLGSRHCFNAIADSSQAQISLERLNQVVHFDEEAKRVTVGAGMRYGDLAPYLHERGYAVHNLASLPHISVAGACATATHGSGVANGNLATAVSAITFIDAGGDLVTLSREKDGERFAGAVVGLGGLGVVTEVTLDVRPAFDMVQHVYLDLPTASLYEHFDEIMSSGYSVSLFTDWRTDAVNQVWVKRVAPGGAFEAEPTFFGAALATRNVHPIIELSAVNCTEQMGVPGPWYERLPHFRMDFTPSSGKELQSEYFVPAEHAREVARIFKGMGERFGSLLMISEVRSVAGDDLWMSMCFDRPSVAFHCTWEQDWEALSQLLPVIEDALEPFEARPHWGKLFTMAPDRLQARYPKASAFRELLREYDPDGKFRNAFMQENLFGG